jgi:N-acetylglucosamine kinase-like BadF-type ATPase
MGLKALQAVVRAADGREPDRPGLDERLLSALGLNAAADLIPWLYTPDRARTREVAQLARVVLAAAAEGLPQAVRLAHDAALELALLGRTAMRQIDMEAAMVAFAGGLLESDNVVSQRLCQLLELPARPVAHYSPVIGAALLARIRLEST